MELINYENERHTIGNEVDDIVVALLGDRWQLTLVVSTDSIRYRVVESLCCIAETTLVSITLNYTQIKEKSSQNVWPIFSYWYLCQILIIPGSSTTNENSHGCLLSQEGFANFWNLVYLDQFASDCLVFLRYNFVAYLSYSHCLVHSTVSRLPRV